MNGRAPRKYDRLTVLGLTVLLANAAAVMHAQDAPPPAVIDDWRMLEPAQDMIDYKAKLKDGVFDETSKTFLVNTALPQLALPKNRATIDKVRKRIREVLCGDAGGDSKATAVATQTVAEFMTALARNDKADVVARVNAALLVGELTGTGRKPWSPAVASLVDMVGDDALPPAVRIAAAAGLARHVDADAEARAVDVAPALVKLATAPLAGFDAVSSDWLRSRALAMLAHMGAAAPAGTAAAAAKVLLDAKVAVDVRVRAAKAVGSTAKAPGDTDVSAAVAAIHGVAKAALSATQEEADRRALANRLTGGRADQPPQIQPVPAFGPEAGVITQGGGSQQYRRNAWRLATLADALVTTDGQGGLVRVAGATAPSVKALADALRQGAVGLDAKPDAESLDAAIKALGEVAMQPAPTTTPGGPPDGEGKPKPPAQQPSGVDGVPFGDR